MLEVVSLSDVLAEACDVAMQPISHARLRGRVEDSQSLKIHQHFNHLAQDKYCTDPGGRT